MEFNIPKYKIMHMGDNNPEHWFNMVEQSQAMTLEERDIGVV
jgi:hypothetical protein